MFTTCLRRVQILYTCKPHVHKLHIVLQVFFYILYLTAQFVWVSLTLEVKRILIVFCVKISGDVHTVPLLIKG